MANKAVFGIYNTRAGAEKAIDRLRADGFRATDISVLLPENLGNKDLAVEGASKAPEGATAGGVTGATIGGGWTATGGDGTATAVEDAISVRRRTTAGGGGISGLTMRNALARRGSGSSSVASAGTMIIAPTANA